MGFCDPNVQDWKHVLITGIRFHPWVVVSVFPEPVLLILISSPFFNLNSVALVSLEMSWIFRQTV